MVENERERWPLTGDWHTGPWTASTSRHLHEHVDKLSRENSARWHEANRRGDRDASQECHQQVQHLWKCLDELRDRDRVARERWHWERGQAVAGRFYAWSRVALLTGVLRRARAGYLVSDWRDNLSAELAHFWLIFGNFAEYHRELGIDDDALATCLINELATTPIRPWEPYAAGGDWHAALDAWYHDSLDLLDWEYRYDEQDRAESDRLDARQVTAFLPEFAAAHLCRQADKATVATLAYARHRDELEASYRAGLAAGGDDQDEDWIEWYCQRITDTWDPDDDTTHPALSPRRASNLLSLAAASRDYSRGCLQRLPAYWTEHH